MAFLKLGSFLQIKGKYITTVNPLLSPPPPATPSNKHPPFQGKRISRPAPPPLLSPYYSSQINKTVLINHNC